MGKVIISSEKQLHKVGAEFAKTLCGGEVIHLIGDMGAGKTVFAKGICYGLGVNQIVTSPTYSIMNEYFGKYKICHYDFYRIIDEMEAEELGLFEYFYKKDYVCIIEWGCNIKSYLNNSTINININKIDETSREVIIHV